MYIRAGREGIQRDRLLFIIILADAIFIYDMCEYMKTIYTFWTFDNKHLFGVYFDSFIYMRDKCISEVQVHGTIKIPAQHFDYILVKRMKFVCVYVCVCAHKIG